MSNSDKTSQKSEKTGKEQKEEENFPLPRLSPFLKLTTGPQERDGSPSWTLHNPISNSFFKISWAEFECLARFSSHENAQNLLSSVNQETTLNLDMDDISQLITFLNEQGLLELNNQNVEFKEKKEQKLWEKLVHSYLFFTLPLIKPEKFLEKTLPLVKPLMSKSFLICMMGVLLIGVFLTLQRLDEFLTTFLQMFSIQGLVMGLTVFAFVKLLHELGHAYMATKYGVKVPHMGIAFVVMYPILYTETTASWNLSSRSARIHIALAGIMAELCLAGIFLILWNIMPSGSIGQSISFYIIAISLIGSLFVNLNPLMRFDGYYLICDLTGFDNLQQRAIAFARWNIRKILFGLKDPAPEDLPKSSQKFLTFFGSCLLIYRFFLFLGIALLVYVAFFKPLGLILMIIELLWFIVMPIFSELKIWWQKKQEIISSPRFILLAILLCFAIGLFAAPSQNTLATPAILHTEKYQSFYPPHAAKIENITIEKEQVVKAGDVLIALHSDELEKDLRLINKKIEGLEELKRQQKTQYQDTSALRQNRDIDQEIKAAKTQQNTLKKKKNKLIIKAPFDGVIKDIAFPLEKNQYVQKTELLFRLVDPDEIVLTGYINEEDLTRIKPGNKAYFYPEYTPFQKIAFEVSTLEQNNSSSLFWPELSSVYGGPLASELTQNPNQTDNLVPRQSLYKVSLKRPQKQNKAQNSQNEKQPSNNLVQKEETADQNQSYQTSSYYAGTTKLASSLQATDNIEISQEGQIKMQFLQRGIVNIQAEKSSNFMRFLRNFVALLIRESGFN